MTFTHWKWIGTMWIIPKNRFRKRDYLYLLYGNLVGMDSQEKKRIPSMVGLGGIVGNVGDKNKDVERNESKGDDDGENVPKGRETRNLQPDVCADV